MGMTDKWAEFSCLLIYTIHDQPLCYHTPDRVSKRARDALDFHLPPPSRQLALLALRTRLSTSPTPLRRLHTFHHTSRARAADLLQVTLSSSKEEGESSRNRFTENA